jgi:hypothetical protein
MEAAAAGDTLDTSANEAATPQIQECKTRARAPPRFRNPPIVSHAFEHPTPPCTRFRVPSISQGYGWS